MATVQLYGKFPANALGGETAGESRVMDWLSDTLKASLHTSTYTPNIDTHELYADATNELSTANGYTNGGVTVATPTVSYNATGNVTTFGAATITFTASGGTLTFRYIVIRDSTPSGEPLVGYIDLGGDFALLNGLSLNLTLASGLWTATVS